MFQIKTNLKANCHPQVDHAEVHQTCVSVRYLLNVLDTVSSYNRRTTQSTDEDMNVLVKQIRELGILWRRHDLSCTPKFYIAECHFAPAMKKLRVLELFSEESIGRTHHEVFIL